MTQPPKKNVAVIVDGYIHDLVDLDSVDLHEVTAGHHCPQCCYECRDWPKYVSDFLKREAKHAEAEALPDRPFVVLSMVHSRDCAAVRSQINRASHLRTLEEYHRNMGGTGTCRWPTYVDETAALATGLPRCSRCCPDIRSSAKPPRPVYIKPAGLGWPMPDGSCARSEKSSFGREVNSRERLASVERTASRESALRVARGQR